MKTTATRAAIQRACSCHHGEQRSSVPTAAQAPSVHASRVEQLGHRFDPSPAQTAGAAPIQRVTVKNKTGGQVDVPAHQINDAIHRRMVNLTKDWNAASDPVIEKQDITSQFQRADALHSGTPTASIAASTPEERFHAVRTIKRNPFTHFQLQGPGGREGSALLNTMVQGKTPRTGHDYFISGESDEGGSYPAIARSFAQIVSDTGKSRKQVAQAHLDLLLGGTPKGFTSDQLARMNEHVNVMSIAEPRRDVGMHLHAYMALHNMANQDEASFDPIPVFGKMEEAKKADSGSGGKTSKSSKKADSGEKKPPKKVETPGSFPPAFKGSKAPLDAYEMAAHSDEPVARGDQKRQRVTAGMATHIDAYFKDRALDADFATPDDAAHAAVEHLIQTLYGGTTVPNPPPATEAEQQRPSSPSRQEAVHVFSHFDRGQLDKSLPPLVPKDDFRNSFFESMLVPMTSHSGPPRRPSSPERRVMSHTMRQLDEGQWSRTFGEWGDEDLERITAHLQSEQTKRKRASEETKGTSSEKKPRLGQSDHSDSSDGATQLRARSKAGASTGYAVAQRVEAAATAPAPAAPQNQTGMPDNLRAGIESLSGMDLSGVRVHRGSARPGQIDALAYTQGDEIHLGPGQDRHLAHEAWHVVQQRQGRVRVTTQVAGKGVNDDDHLEREADQMGSRALQMMASPALAGPRAEPAAATTTLATRSLAEAPVQGFWPFTDSHAPPANIGERVAALRQGLANAGGGDRANAGWFGARQNDFHQVEDDVHTWWRDHGHLATDEQRQQMSNHLYDLEDHHEDLTAVQVQHDHPLWLPAGTSLVDQGRANQVWNDVRGGTGNLRISQGGADFTSRTLAGVARLLEQPHGRDMLHELNANQPDANRQVHIGADWSGEFAHQGREYQAGSWATPLVAGTQAHRRVDALTPGAGVGSYVQTVRGHRETETGAHGTGVPMPYYQTLGHELGHALHSLRGTSAGVPDDDPAFAGLDATEQSLWSNAEEHQNITQNENAIRGQHGLPTRAYHRPPQVVRATHMKNDLRDRIDQVRGDFPHDPRLPLLDPSEPLFYEQDGIHEPAFYEEANRHIDSLYRNRNLGRALKIGGGLAALGGLAYGLSRWRGR